MADKAAYTEAKAPFIRQVLGIPDQRGPQTGSER
jgi:hypothetical protein